MNLFKSLSIKRKLMLIMMTTSATAIFLMAFLVVINQAINSQHAIRQQLITLADVLGTRSTGALSFDDPTTGEEILNGLALKSNVTFAVIEQVNGDSFATFGDPSIYDEPLKSNALNITSSETSVWSTFFSNQVHVSRDIFLDNERIGTIHIISDLSALYKDLLNYMFLLTMISIFCFAISFLFCSRLQKIISDPILNLQITMDSVSENKDYSLRVKNSEENELKALINGFNHMLEQIQSRDNKLAENSAHLEKIVTTRTLQLTDANEKRILWLESMARFLKHELKNSSVGIKTSLDLIERRMTEKKKIDVYITRARTSMVNMNSLLQSAGDASNLEASLYKEEQKPLDLGKTVCGHMELYPSIYPDFSIRADCQPGLMILGNGDRLIQLLDKLITNAVDHSNRRYPIEVTVKQQHEKVLIIVTNRGDRLPSDKQAIFDLFVSFRTSEQKKADNFGLGLYIVKLIAESHGGQVVAYDLATEKGAVFEVTLPLIDI